MQSTHIRHIIYPEKPRWGKTLVGMKTMPCSFMQSAITKGNRYLRWSYLGHCGPNGCYIIYYSLCYASHPPLIVAYLWNNTIANGTPSSPNSSIFNIALYLSYRVNFRVFSYLNSRLGLGFWTVLNVLEIPHMISSTCVRNESQGGIHFELWWQFKLREA